MKTNLATYIVHIVIVAILATVGVSYSQRLFDGEILFKGRVQDSKFTGRRFSAEITGGKLTVVCVGSGNRFQCNADQMTVSDMVLSLNESFLAISLVNRNLETREMELVILGKDGTVSRFPYESGHLGPNYGWIVELAAVSNDGKHILAKCARMTEVEGGMRLAGHDWVVLDNISNRLDFGDSVEMLQRWEELLASTDSKPFQLDNGKTSPSDKPESPNNIGAAPHQPQEGQPPAKPGSGPK